MWETLPPLFNHRDRSLEDERRAAEMWNGERGRGLQVALASVLVLGRRGTKSDWFGVQSGREGEWGSDHPRTWRDDAKERHDGGRHNTTPPKNSSRTQPSTHCSS
jgi:hypothetical protein